jgi:nanoRNase/pAp phosphatase (c-di-AMP/oligoRNAs hydrolase)
MTDMRDELPSGRYRVSPRSKGGTNVAAVAEPFGGGTVSWWLDML